MSSVALGSGEVASGSQAGSGSLDFASGGSGEFSSGSGGDFGSGASGETKTNYKYHMWTHEA